MQARKFDIHIMCMIKRMLPFLNIRMGLIAGVLQFSSAMAQTPFQLAPQHPAPYDKRFIIPDIKQVNVITLSTLFCVDSKSIYRDKEAGNVDTGLNIGFGLGYAKALINSEYYGLFVGVGYEYFPSKYQSVKCFFEYKSPYFFRHQKIKYFLKYKKTFLPQFEFIFPKYEYLYGWDAMHQHWTQQRFYFLNIRSGMLNFNYGVQFGTAYHVSSNVFELSYNLFPKKW